MAAAGLRASSVFWTAADAPSLQGELVHRRFKPLYANSAFARLCGYDEAGEVLAAGDALSFFDECTRSAPEASWRALVAQSSTYGRRWFRRRDGGAYPAEFYARPVQWHGGPAVAMSVLDLTELERAREALMLARARELFRARAEQAANAKMRRRLEELHALAGGEDGAAADILLGCERILQGAPQPQPLSTLVVADDAAERAAIAAALQALGCAAHAATAWTAPRAAAARRYDIILFDIAQSPADLFGRVGALRKAAAAPPIVALAALGRAAQRDQIADAGFDGFLQKPLDLVCLAETLALLALGPNPACES